MESQIDEVLRRAILREIGERLQACLREEELPARLKAHLHRLRQLDDQSPRTTRDPPPREQTVAPREQTVARWLVTRMRRRIGQR
jgi:hypothetical protein